MLSEKTKAVIVNTPNNPTGVVYSEATIQKMAAILETKQKEFGTSIYLISDEPYRELAYDGVEVPYLTKYYRNTIVGYSFSKSLSLPGERIGYLVMPDELDGAKDIIAAAAVANRIPVEELRACDIGCTVKLKDVKTGNTLNGKDCDNRFNFIKYPNAKYSRAIKPLNEADVEKMMVVLNRMREEDPTWEIEQSKELKQTIVHGQCEFHLRTLKWRLENNEKLQIKFEEPKIPYRETITKAARADYRHKKQSGGAGQFGEVHLIVEPYYEGMPVPDTYKFNGQEFKINVYLSP